MTLRISIRASASRTSTQNSRPPVPCRTVPYDYGTSGRPYSTQYGASTGRTSAKCRETAVPCSVLNDTTRTAFRTNVTAVWYVFVNSWVSVHIHTGIRLSGGLTYIRVSGYTLFSRSGQPLYPPGRPPFRPGPPCRTLSVLGWPQLGTAVSRNDPAARVKISKKS